MKTSVLPAGARLMGEIEGRGDLLVAGHVEGPISVEGTVTIDEGAEVRGDVQATAIVVRGLLVGAATAKESVRVEPSGTVVGDARAPRVNIIDGARFRGRVQMTGDASVAPAPRRRRTRRLAEGPSVASEDVSRPEPTADHVARRSEPRVEARAEGRPEPAVPRPEARRTERREAPREVRRDERREAPREVRRDERRPGRGDEPGPPAARAPLPAVTEPAEPVVDAMPGPESRRAPPPPRIPGVVRQKVRRKDRASAPSDGL
jgi:cytoskeletal protein CcmA (bactofilin family)